MKPIYITLTLSLALAATACGSLFTTSDIGTPSTSGNVTVGVSSGNSPYYYSPYYYNSPYYYDGPYYGYPTWSYYPPAVTYPPVRPGWNRPTGNIRPGFSKPQQNPSAPNTTPNPAPQPAVKLPASAADVPNIRGSNPGIALPPAGSGFTYTPRH